jgi:hypothetical protein
MAASDIPLDAPGIPWDVWYEQQIDRIFAEAREKQKQQSSSTKAMKRSSANITCSRSADSIPIRDEDRLLEISSYDE